MSFFIVVLLFPVDLVDLPHRPEWSIKKQRACQTLGIAWKHRAGNAFRRYWQAGGPLELVSMEQHLLSIR
ncbi:MAG: hypothetical protein CMJ81_15265 [Planctomycetaceae bacterium]|nr:hypothetical protein [Planctomycetaceae bacterium]